jgi:hypothetical protein
MALTLGASAASLTNRFAGDDVYIISLNERVHALAPAWEYLRQSYWPAQYGGGLYRPATVLSFALQWKAGGGHPFLFHAVNLLLYLGATFAVWVLARRLLPPVAAWLTAAVFAVNPVHVEAVANVVGQPEVLVAGLQAVAVTWYLTSRRAGGPGPAASLGIAGLYAISCLSKENGLVLPGLLLAAEWLLLPEGGRGAERFRRLVLPFGLLAIVAVVFLAGRATVLGGVVGEYPNPAIRDVSVGIRLLTMLAVVPQWWRLLLTPWHLQADYMPLELDRASGVGVAQLLGAVFVLGWVWGVWRSRRDLPVTAFGLCWTAVTLFPVSNVVVPTGILLAERTLFSPSIGACLALGGLAPWIRGRVSAARSWERHVALGMVVVILGLWGWRSASRATIWHDDERLIRQTALDAPLSYRAHALMGRLYFDTGDPEGGEREYLTAIHLYPYDANVFAGLAQRYRNAELYQQAIPLFRKALELAPEMIPARNMLIACLVNTGDHEAALRELAEKERRRDADTDRIRAMIDSVEHERHSTPSSSH